MIRFKHSIITLPLTFSIRLRDKSYKLSQNFVSATPNRNSRYSNDKFLKSCSCLSVFVVFVMFIEFTSSILNCDRKFFFFITRSFFFICSYNVFRIRFRMQRNLTSHAKLNVKHLQPNSSRLTN